MGTPIGTISGEIVVKLSSTRPIELQPAKKPEAIGLGFRLVELRGLEPLTPTLPGAGITPEPQDTAVIRLWWVWLEM